MEREPEHETRRSRPVSILVVDDDAAIRELMAELLSGQGFTVHQADNGRRAMEAVEREAVDLVITDLIMPEQEGLQTIRQLRQKYPHIRVIATSGYLGADHLQHASVFGACATLRKPFPLDSLLRTVEKVLQTD